MGYNKHLKTHNNNTTTQEQSNKEQDITQAFTRIVMLKTRRDSAFIPAKTEGTAAALSSTLKQTLIPLGEEQRTRVSDLETPAKLNFVDGIRKRFTLVRNSQFYDDISNIHPNDDVEKAQDYDDDDDEEECVEVCCWKIPILTSVSRANDSSDHRFRSTQIRIL